MNDFPMFSKKVTAGLDLGAHSLKYAVVEAGSGRVLDLWRSEIFPDRRTRDETLRKELLRSQIKKLLKTCQRECLSFTPSVVTTIR